jgi:hypothetical protein
VKLTPSDASLETQLRSQPREWHRRGMRHPAELARIVADRVAQDVSRDARYEDFLVAPEDEDATIAGDDQ